MKILDDKINKVFSNENSNKESAIKLKKNLNLPMHVVENILINNKSSNSQCTREIYHSIQNKIINTKDNLKIQDKIRQQGSLTLVDKIMARSITSEHKYWAQLINLGVKKAKISKEIVRNYPQLLETGIWAEITINYLDNKATSNSEFEIQQIIPYEKTKFKLDNFKTKAKEFTNSQWRYLLLRSIGIEPLNFSKRQQLLLLSRLIPFVEKNYNFIELGARGTGKSYLYRQLFNQSILVSGGKTTVANLFYNMGTKEVGLVGKWDVVAFDEVAYIDFKDKTAVQILKDYMESGAFSRGKEEINASASMVFLGNINDDIRKLLHNSDLFQPLPNSMKDIALIDRFHFYLPGWELKKLKENDFTNQFGLQSGYLALALNRLRKLDFTDLIDDYFKLDSRMDIRDKKAIQKTVSGYIKLLHPAKQFNKKDIKLYLDLAIEGRKRVKEQLVKMGNFEYQQISFEYTCKQSENTYYPTLPEKKLEANFKRKLAKPGVAYLGQIIGQEFALLKIEIKMEPGDGKLIFANQHLHQQLKQDIRKTFLFIKGKNNYLDLKNKLLNHNFLIKVEGIKNQINADISAPFFLAIYSILKKKSIPHGLLVTEESSLYHNPDNNYKLKAVKIKDANGRTKTLIPLDNEVYIEVPAKVIEKVPFFVEV